jgi:branched-chain amino acid transport system permease protein
MTLTTPEGAVLPVADHAAPTFRPGAVGLVGRGFVWVALGVALLLPMLTVDFAQACSLAAIYGIVGLSLNIVVGYTGQLSLGHQGFLGLGALTAANIVFKAQVPFYVGLIGGVVAATVAAVVLGLVALRITGLYLSLITLVFGTAIASSLFSLGSLTRNGSGVPANRPESIHTNARYYLLCLVVMLVIFYLDTRLTASKTGRALLAIKENERVAEAFGVGVTSYKLIAFGLSGAIAGLAGGLFAFRSQTYAAQDFTETGLSLALLFVVMVVVGGLGNRVGVVIAAAFFALLNYLLDKLFISWHGFRSLVEHVPVLNGYYGPNKGALAGLIGAVLLLQTLIFNPGGIGQSVAPIQRWLKGKPFSLHDDSAASGPGHVEGSHVRA